MNNRKELGRLTKKMKYQTEQSYPKTLGQVMQKKVSATTITAIPTTKISILHLIINYFPDSKLICYFLQIFCFNISKIVFSYSIPSFAYK